MKRLMLVLVFFFGFLLVTGASDSFGQIGTTVPSHITEEYMKNFFVLSGGRTDVATSRGRTVQQVRAEGYTHRVFLTQPVKIVAVEGTVDNAMWRLSQLQPPYNTMLLVGYTTILTKDNGIDAVVEFSPDGHGGQTAGGLSKVILENKIIFDSGQQTVVTNSTQPARSARSNSGLFGDQSQVIPETAREQEQVVREDNRKSKVYIEFRNSDFSANIDENYAYEHLNKVVKSLKEKGVEPTDNPDEADLVVDIADLKFRINRQYIDIPENRQKNSITGGLINLGEDLANQPGGVWGEILRPTARVGGPIARSKTEKPTSADEEKLLVSFKMELVDRETGRISNRIRGGNPSTYRKPYYPSFGQGDSYLQDQRVLKYLQRKGIAPDKNLDRDSQAILLGLSKKLLVLFGVDDLEGAK